MNRGEIYTAATGHGYGGKPRPVLVIQGNDYCHMAKILAVLIGSPADAAEAIRISIAPDAVNGLHHTSEIMIDSVVPVRTEKFGRYVGTLAQDDMRRVDNALLTFMGFAQTS